MTEAPKRDPLSVVLQLLTLGVLAWIGFSIASLPERTVPAEPDFDRLAAVLEARLGRDSAATPIVDAAATRPRPSPIEARTSAPEPARHRLTTPRPAPASGDSLYGLEPDATRETRVKTMAGIRAELDLDSDAGVRARKRFLLMSRRELVQRFGRPDDIQLNQNGLSEGWTYVFGPEQQLTFTIHDGYVISLW